jgi:hypothetical protein
LDPRENDLRRSIGNFMLISRERGDPAEIPYLIKEAKRIKEKREK